jgi:hypothetical protein
MDPATAAVERWAAAYIYLTYAHFLRGAVCSRTDGKILMVWAAERRKKKNSQKGRREGKKEGDSNSIAGPKWASL